MFRTGRPYRAGSPNRPHEPAHCPAGAAAWSGAGAMSGPPGRRRLRNEEGRMRYARSGRCYFQDVHCPGDLYRAAGTPQQAPELVVLIRPLGRSVVLIARPWTTCLRVIRRLYRSPGRGYGRSAATTVRVADGEPGTECQLDFGFLGLLTDPVSGRAAQRVRADLHRGAIRGTRSCGCSSPRPWPRSSPGCEGAAWAFFGGRVPGAPAGQRPGDRGGADAVNPRFTAGWLDYGPAAAD